jgi:hypothetical protein
MALTKVRGGAIDNPLTLGGGSASDNSIIFDGNAQDFHIGLDDSSDSLTIGLGSALGTTSHMVFDANGRITKPLQPMFSVDGSASYVAYNDGDVLAFNNESSTGRFDNGGHFDTSTYTFTVPVTGKYFVSAFAIQSDSNFTGGVIIQHRNSGGTVIESLRGYQNGARNSRVSVLISCTASDTLRVTTQNAGSYYLGNGYGRFSGFLVG